MRENLKSRRKSLNLTQTKMAERIGTTTKHISDIETGRCGCSFEIAIKISKILLYDLDHNEFMMTAYDGINRLGIEKVKQLAKTFNVEFFDYDNLFGE